MKIFLLTLMCVSFSFSQNEHIISVTGIGKVKFKPNTIDWIAQIESIHKNLETSRNRIDVIFNQVKGKLIKLGIKKRNIVLTNNRQQKRYEYSKGKQQFIGYASSVNLNICSKNIFLYQKVNDILITADEISVRNTVYSHDKSEQFENTALIIAIKHAKSKASLIAKQLSLNLGKAIKIMESVSHKYPQPRLSQADMSFVQAKSSVDISDHMGSSFVIYKIKINFSVN